MNVRTVAVILFVFLIASHARAEIRHSLPDIPDMPAPSASVAVTWEPQLPDYCGEACYVMALRVFGVYVTQKEIHRASGLTVRRGCFSEDLYAAGLALGIKGEYYQIEGFRSNEGHMPLECLKSLLARGWPVVVSFNENPRHHRYDTYEHFVLATGFDEARGTVIVMDPDLGPAEGRVFSYEEFMDHWQWRNPDGTRSCLMYAIGGVRDGVPAPMGEVGGTLADGENVDYRYEAESDDEYFFILKYPPDDMDLSIRAYDDEKKPIGEWETKYLDNAVFSLTGVDRAFITIRCTDGGGAWRLLYEAGDVSPQLR